MSQDQDNPDREQAEDDLKEWLTEHPEALDDLADLHRLRELYQSVRLPQPDEKAWTTTRSRIYEAVSANRPQSKHSSRSRWAILSLTAAAAVLAGVLLARSWWTKTTPEEPFPVVEAGDVTIISMDARDVAASVVGEPPVSGDLEFVQMADIRVIKCQRCPKSGKVPRLAQGEVPMFVTSVARANESEE